MIEKYTTNKIKIDVIFVIQFDKSDENCTVDNVREFAEKAINILPDMSSVIILPNYMTLDSMDKETFRKFLDDAEEFYKTL